MLVGRPEGCKCAFPLGGQGPSWRRGFVKLDLPENVGNLLDEIREAVQKYVGHQDRHLSLLDTEAPGVKCPGCSDD